MSADNSPNSVLVFRAIPHDRTVLGRIGPQGTPIYQLPCEMDMPGLREPVEARKWQEIIHDPGMRFALPSQLKAVVNVCASPEHYPLSLSALDAALRPGIAVLNHPRAVMWTRRDLAAQALAQIPFLQVPKVHRFLPEKPGDFMAAFQAGDFRYPVLLEPAATDEGLERHEITHPDEWAPLFRKPWVGRVWIMTQFAQGRSPWRLRIGMAGRTAHFETYLSAKSPGGQPPVLRSEVIRDMVNAVRKCIPLDVATLVVTLAPDRLLLDRIDAGLPVPLMAGAQSELVLCAKRIRTALAPSLASLLQDTSLWRTDSGRLPATPAASVYPRTEGT